MRADLRLGMVGGGRWGRPHAGALRTSEDVTVVAIAEPFEAAADALRAEGYRVYPTPAAMYAAEQLDGVLIAVPTDRHIATATEAIQAGVNVLCEKPFGTDPDQARVVGRLADDAGVALQIAYWRRFVPAIRALRARITAGEFGIIHLLTCLQWDEAPPALAFRAHSGGIFVDMGVHEIEQARWLLGEEVTDVYARAHPRTLDPEATDDVDGAQALVTFTSGTQTLISLGRFYPGGDMVTAELFGTGTHARAEVLTPESGVEPQLAALRAQASAFARYARGGPREGTTAEDAATVLETARTLTTVANLAVLGNSES